MMVYVILIIHLLLLLMDFPVIGRIMDVLIVRLVNRMITIINTLTVTATDTFHDVLKCAYPPRLWHALLLSELMGLFRAVSFTSPGVFDSSRIHWVFLKRHHKLPHDMILSI